MEDANADGIKQHQVEGGESCEPFESNEGMEDESRTEG